MFVARFNGQQLNHRFTHCDCATFFHQRRFHQSNREQYAIVRYDIETHAQS